MNILLCDDHALFREGLSHILNKLDTETEVLVHEVESVEHALEFAEFQQNIDLILLDLNLPGMNGIDGLKSLQSCYAFTPIVMLSASEANSDIRNALANGAMGYICKSMSSQNMLNALKLVLAGDVYIPTIALQDNQQTVSIQTSLTNRQLDVLKLLQEGLANKLIADKLHISEATVKMHITAIFKTLNVSNRTQAVLKAQTRGLL